jgi:hypothetical protein
MWTHAGAGVIALGDYKGRLLYSSGAPRAFGADLRALEAVARAYDSRGPAAMLVPARSSGIVEAGDGPLFLLAGAAVPGSVPRAVLVQGVDANRVLADETPRDDRRLALVAGDVLVGELPPAGSGWLVVTRPLPGPDGAPIGTIVLGAAVANRPGAAALGVGAAGLVLALLLGLRAYRGHQFLNARAVRA